MLLRKEKDSWSQELGQQQVAAFRASLSWVHDLGFPTGIPAKKKLICHTQGLDSE